MHSFGRTTVCSRNPFGLSRDCWVLLSHLQPTCITQGDWTFTSHLHQSCTLSISSGGQILVCWPVAKLLLTCACAGMLVFKKGVSALLSTHVECYVDCAIIHFHQDIAGLKMDAITTPCLCHYRWTFGDVFWCSGGCPFDTAPRWLGWPSEAFVNQCTESGTAWVTHMTQVVKSFGTAKVRSVCILLELHARAHMLSMLWVLVASTLTTNKYRAMHEHVQTSCSHWCVDNQAASEYFSMVQPSPRFTELFWSYMVSNPAPMQLLHQLSVHMVFHSG